MRISRQCSLNNLALLIALLGATSALAQDSAGRSIAREGGAAMDRLKGAISHQEEYAGTIPAPILPVLNDDADRRRAFDGLRKRMPNAAMETRARAAVAQGEASLAAEREAQAKRLREALGLEPSEGQALAKAAPSVAPRAWVPVIFASSSMPMAVLRNYAAQLQKVHGVLAFRGMPGGLHKVGPMANLTAQILRLDPGCEGPNCAMRDVQVIVDPIIFRQHDVGRVPALAMVPGDPTQAYCERADDSPRAAFLVFGDSALSGLLDEYARLGGREEVRDAQALLGSL